MQGRNLDTAGSLGGFRFDEHAPYDATRKSLIRRYKLPSDRWVRSIFVDERVQVLSSSSANFCSSTCSCLTSTSPTDLLTAKTRLWLRRWKNASTHHQRKLALVLQEVSSEETTDFTCVATRDSGYQISPEGSEESGEMDQAWQPVARNSMVGPHYCNPMSALIAALLVVLLVSCVLARRIHRVPLVL